MGIAQLDHSREWHSPITSGHSGIESVDITAKG